MIPSRRLFAPGLLFLAGCGEEDSGAPRVSETPAPSILVITLDTARRDFMGFHGRLPSPTPHLDDLARRSTVFDDAYTVAPLTLPAHASLFTGLYPTTHGVRDNGLFRLSESATTLAEVFADRGYETGASVASFVLDANFGLAQGFAHYQAPDRVPSALGDVGIAELAADRVVDRALAFLGDCARPFFFWLHLFDPHAPYEPPGVTISGGGDRVTLYEEEIRFADEQIGRLLEGLAEAGDAERLVVLFAADHGESLGDARENTHGYFLYDPTTRIPLFLRHPSLQPGRYPHPVSLVDMTPTLLALESISPAEGVFDGVDLTPGLATGAPPGPERSLALESHAAFHGFGWAPLRGTVLGPLKFVRGGRRELYERDLDPGETDNLIGSAAGPEARMEARWTRHFESGPPRFAESHSLSAEERAQLNALGYLVGSAPKHEERPDYDALPDALDKLDVLRRSDEAMQHVRDGKPEAAIEALRELVVMEPGGALFHERLGALLTALHPDRVDEAERHFRAALEVDSSRGVARYGLGFCASRRAEAAHARANELARAGRADEARAAQQEQIERLAEAVVHYKLLLTDQPRQPEALVAVAGIMQSTAERWVRAGNVAKGREMYADALSHLDLYLEVVPRSHREWKRYEQVGQEWRRRLGTIR